MLYTLDDCIDRVLWLNGSDFVVEEINEDITCHHPVLSQKHFGAPAHHKPAPNLSTDLSATVHIRTAYSASPAFLRAQKNVSKSVRSLSIPVCEILKSAPESEIPESASESEIPEHAPESEIPESAPESEIPESDPVSEIPKSAPSSEIPEPVPVREIQSLFQ